MQVKHLYPYNKSEYFFLIRETKLKQNLKSLKKVQQEKKNHNFPQTIEIGFWFHKIKIKTS